MKKIFSITKAHVLVVVMSVAVFGLVIWDKVSSFVQRGLSDSASMRVSEKASCDESATTDSSAKFSGCNSVL